MSNQNQSVRPVENTSIAIELLRTGTPHNQTLSPGVTYLALCGAHPPAEFKINLEQYKFSRYLQLLRYQEGTEKSSSIQLAKEALQEIITKIFEEIPALQIEASSYDGWLHLRLVMTPRELAMLPFELALTPNGFQGARYKPFLLNPQRLTTITREVRQVVHKKFDWPFKPRILFLWAQPENSVPYEAHLIKLKEALRPWACPNTKSSTPEADDSNLLTVLPKASFSMLQSTLKEAVRQDKPFTHIHILAHGIAIPDPDNGPRYALALQLVKSVMKSDGSMTDTDAVDADQLADALLVIQDNKTYNPAIVTIAACDGGNEGTNLLPGGSLAHVLHQSGIPYVLASQFPLSKDGSTQLVEEFYPRILQGEDPRIALYYARKAVDRADIHDWASLVAYARFSDDFDDQLEDVQLKIALEIMKTATAWTDFVVNNKVTGSDIYNEVGTRLKSAISKLENLLNKNTDPDKNPTRIAEHRGLLGSAYKRLAEHYYLQGNIGDAATKETSLADSVKALESARGYYQLGHDGLLVNHWTAVQYLSLTAVLKGSLSEEFDRWWVTKFAAEKDLEKSVGIDKAWPLGTLAELYLLKPLTLPDDEYETEKSKSFEKASFYLNELNKLNFPFAKESTARQLDRYIIWWPNAFPSSTIDRLKDMAKMLRDLYPKWKIA